MKINYKIIEEIKSVDINKLRPKHSYRYLMQNRNHNIEHLFVNGNIPEKLLNRVPCHCCGSDNYTKLFEKDGLDLYDVHWMKKEGYLEEEFSLSERLIEVLQFLSNAGGHGKNLRCVAKKKQ